MALINSRTGVALAANCIVAADFWRRLKGLLGTKELPEGQALIIMPCNSVHTFGMNYPIDVVFLDGKNRVLKTVSTLRPGKMSACSGSSYVVELPSGTLERTGTRIDDILEYR